MAEHLPTEHLVSADHAIYTKEESEFKTAVEQMLAVDLVKHHFTPRVTRALQTANEPATEVMENSWIDEINADMELMAVNTDIEDRTAPTDLFDPNDDVEGALTDTEVPAVEDENPFATIEILARPEEKKGGRG